MPLRLQPTRLPPLFKAMTDRAREGFSGPLGRTVAQIIRTGPGSVDEQFSRAAMDSALTGRAPWDPVQPFGDRPPPSSPLQRTGRLRRSWLGQDSSSFTTVTPTSVAIGVRASSNPTAATHQFGATIKARRFTASGRPVMQIFLIRQFNARVSTRKLLDGLKVPARPVAVSSRVLERISRALTTYIGTGRVTSTPGAGGR